eukprot:3611650-Rhodomonas_salina.1
MASSREGVQSAPHSRAQCPVVVGISDNVLLGASSFHICSHDHVRTLYTIHARTALRVTHSQSFPP